MFYEHGPVAEVLMDNALAFHSHEMTVLLEKWGVRAFFRAAYRASGNGIVERCHRTIKAMAERSGKSPIDAVFYYNVAPRYGQQPETVPQKSVATYSWRVPGVTSVTRPRESDSTSGDCRVEVGEEVWVRPGAARCTTQWDRGIVTGVNSSNNVEVDGVPRHVLDLRPIVGDDIEQDQTVEETEEERRYPRRDRSAPGWMRDYVVE